jgi:F-type H+-transporting ATPase subunit b
MNVTLALAGNSILSIDGSFLLIWASVWCLIFILTRTLFRPVIAILEERERLGAGRIKESRQMLAQYEERLKKYENEIRAARASAFTQFEARRREMLAEHANLIANARNDVRAQVEAAKNEIAIESVEARKQLEHDAQAMATEITSRLINRLDLPGSHQESRL